MVTLFVASAFHSVDARGWSECTAPFLSLVWPWPLTLTFKIVRERDQKSLLSEFRANPFSRSRDLTHKQTKKNKKNLSHTALKTEPYLRVVKINRTGWFKLLVKFKLVLTSVQCCSVVLGLLLWTSESDEIQSLIFCPRQQLHVKLLPCMHTVQYVLIGLKFI